MSATDATLRMVLLGEDRSASKALKGLGDQTDKTASKASKATEKLKGLGKIAALGVAGGLVLAGKAAFDFTKRAVEDQASAQKLATTLKNTTGATKDQQAAVEDWISSQERAVGVSDDDLRPALSKLAIATGSVSKAQNLAKLAMDISAGSGKSLESVSMALAKAQNGNVGGLSRLGVATKDAAGKTMSLHDITKQLVTTYKGDAAKAADTAAGKQKILSVQLAELKETIGYKLLPVFQALVSFLVDKGIPAVSSLSAWFRDTLIPIIKNVAGVFKGNTGQMSATVKKDFGSIRDTISSVVSIARSIWRHFGSFIVEYIGTTLKAAIQIIGGALKIIQGIFKVFSSLLRGDWKGVWQGIKEILSGSLQVLKGLLRGALGALKLIWKVGWVVLKAILGQVWDGIKALAKVGINGLVDLIRGVPGDIKGLAHLYLAAGKTLITALFNGLKATGSAVGGVAKAIANDLIDMLNNVLPHQLHIAIPHAPDVNVPLFPTIPHLAKGGIVTRPTMALIGEAGPEAVVPLSGRNAGKFGGGDVQVTVVASNLVDPQQTARLIQTELLKLKRQRGGLELGIS